MAKGLYDNGHFHSFDRDYEMRKFIHRACRRDAPRAGCGMRAESAVVQPLRRFQVHVPQLV